MFRVSQKFELTYFFIKSLYNPEILNKVFIKSRRNLHMENENAG